MPKIFISYRRDDSKYQADRLHQSLMRVGRVPKRDIFIDIDNIPVGVDFVEYLDGQVKQCDVLLALIGPDWLTVANPRTGQRRLDDPKDFVRIEIASALKRGIQVAPVMLDGTPFPSEDNLPDELKPLTRRHGVDLRRESFDADAERMIRKLKLATTASGQGKPGDGTPGWIAPAIAVVLLAALGGGVWFGNPGDWRGLKADADPLAIAEEALVGALVLEPMAAEVTPLTLAEMAERELSGSWNVTGEADGCAAGQRLEVTVAGEQLMVGGEAEALVENGADGWIETLRDGAALRYKREGAQLLIQSKGASDMQAFTRCS
ncbi:MAG: toll/interleukin-1 receptor domain-containing protein [Alphaproteobacteria bacterium]|nr:toll/interleukin-1 receptor domain-containing protein [Alphaproteobacteria bacterium]